jgi:hypothetical protein
LYLDLLLACFVTNIFLVVNEVVNEKEMAGMLDCLTIVLVMSCNMSCNCFRPLDYFVIPATHEWQLRFDDIT